MKVVILAGGKGKRLYPLTKDIPKPLLEIGGQPILWHIMKIFSTYGFKEFIICAGYKAWKIKEYFLNFLAINQDFTIRLKDGSIRYHEREGVDDWEVTVASTGENTNTGGRLLKIRHFLERDSEGFFCLSYGDCLGNVNIGKMVDSHKRSGKKLTALFARQPNRYREWKFSKEKISPLPLFAEECGWICGGFFVVSKDLLELISTEDCDWNEILNWCYKNKELNPFIHEGFWYSLETLKDLEYLNQLWSSGKTEWKIW